MGTQWIGYYSTLSHTRVCKNTRTRARTLVGNNFSVLPYTLCAPKHSYRHFNYEKTIKYRVNSVLSPVI